MRFIPVAIGAVMALGVSLSFPTVAGAQAYTPLETIPGTPPEPPAQAIGPSKGEALAAKQFGWLDLNRDGFLSRDEVALFPRLRDAFDEADQDRDNRVSLEEIRDLAVRKRAERAAPAPAAVPVPTTPATPARVVPPKEW